MTKLGSIFKNIIIFKNPVSILVVNYFHMNNASVICNRIFSFLFNSFLLCFQPNAFFYIGFNL